MSSTVKAREGDKSWSDSSSLSVSSIPTNFEIPLPSSALLTVAQHLVGFGDLAELSVGFVQVVWIFVRMPFEG
jgi:hypothetical protein